MFKELFDEMKKEFETRQSYETVEIVESFIGRHILKFKLQGRKTGSIVIFSLRYEEDGLFPVDVTTTDDDYEYHDIASVKTKMHEIINKRVNFSQNYFNK